DDDAELGGGGHIDDVIAYARAHDGVEASERANHAARDRREDVDERVGVARAGDEHVRVGDKRQCRYARRHAIERGLAVAPIALDLSLDDVDAVGPVDHVDSRRAVYPIARPAHRKQAEGGSRVMGKLQNKVAIVTGASKGIGASIARHLADAGAAVVVNYASSKKDAERVVEDITRAGGRAVAVQANVAKQADVDRLFAETKKAFGRLDILVNNAGVYEFAPLEQVTEENFRKQFDTNVLGVLLTSQAAVLHFGADGGSIINISSVASTATPPTASVYSATKAAVDAVTRSLAKELGARNIRVNAINPGTV